MLNCDLFSEYKRALVSVHGFGIVFEERDDEAITAFACLVAEICSVKSPANTLCALLLSFKSQQIPVVPSLYHLNRSRYPLCPLFII
jgi:hypothetical protein